jgi:2'-5' RNA ligase
VYSLNVPVPSDVTTLATSLARDLPGARARTRGEHTLVLKRLGTGDRSQFQRVAARVRDALIGTPTFRACIPGIEFFQTATDGTSPVVYLAVESPELRRLHDRLCGTVDPVAGMEGEAYVPHVTVARGGSVEAAGRLAARDIDPVTWTVTELQFWDAERSLAAGTVSLPA